MVQVENQSTLRLKVNLQTHQTKVGQLVDCLLKQHLKSVRHCHLKFCCLAKFSGLSSLLLKPGVRKKRWLVQSFHCLKWHDLKPAAGHIKAMKARKAEKGRYCMQPDHVVNTCRKPGEFNKVKITDLWSASLGNSWKLNIQEVKMNVLVAADRQREASSHPNVLVFLPACVDLNI